jgi:ribosome-associated toxin RatA of RatAB toxin-antitoxin module
MSDKPSRIVVRHSMPGTAEDVWIALQDQARWVPVVDDVLGVEVLTGDDALAGDVATREVSWQVWLKGFELRWQETQQLDSGAMRLAFQQSEGMFATYGGHYQVTSNGDGAEVELHLDVATGMPFLDAIIDPVISDAFAALAHELLLGVERLALVTQPA